MLLQFLMSIPITYHAIVCHDLQGGIAKEGTIPWKAPKDLRWFRQQTKGPGKAVVMGRKTWDSLPKKPLDGRINLILTGSISKIVWNPQTQIGFFPNINDLILWIAYNKDITDVYIIGGAIIFRELLQRVPIQHLWVTQIMADFNCDTCLNPSDIPYDKFILETSCMYNDHEHWFRRQHWIHKDYHVQQYHSIEEIRYLELLQTVKLTGKLTKDRTGVGTLSVFGKSLEFDLACGFPLLTTKRVFFRGVAEELFWFLKGDTNVKNLQAKGIHIWDGNTSREYLDKIGHYNRLEGDAGKIYGFQWRHWGAKYIDCYTDYQGHGYDQIQEVINLIRTNPNSRRILFSAWNPQDLADMALPPCHVLYQFYVQQDGCLACQMYQRSADLFLGVPFNIASTALLTTLIATTCDRKPGKIRVVFGDAHIYLNHLDAVEEQLNRLPRSFPKLTIKHKRERLEDYQWSDLLLEGYNPHPAIKAPMAT